MSYIEIDPGYGELVVSIHDLWQKDPSRTGTSWQ